MVEVVEEYGLSAVGEHLPVLVGRLRQQEAAGRSDLEALMGDLVSIGMGDEGEADLRIPEAPAVVAVQHRCAFVELPGDARIQRLLPAVAFDVCGNAVLGQQASDKAGA